MRIVRYTQPRQLGFGTEGLSRRSLATLQDELDRLFESAVSDFTALSSGFLGANLSRLPVDLYEDKDSAYVRAEIPGLTREDINVEFSNGFLTISGTRKERAGDGQEGEAYSFSRSIEIPEEVDAEKVSARYEDGVLTVTLPKREESKPRKISVDIK